MAKRHIALETVEIVDWYMNYLKTTLADYDLFKISNGRISDNPNVLDVHPIAMETGALVSSENPKNYKSVLPAIGVEMQQDPETYMRLGEGQHPSVITQDDIDYIRAMTMKQRYTEGKLVSDEGLSELQTAIDKLAGDPLWAEKLEIIHQPTIMVALWSDDPQVTRILYRFVRAALHRSRTDLRKRGITTTINGNVALYNFDFGRMLVGAEFTIQCYLILRLFDVEVTSPTSTLAKGDTSALRTSGSFVWIGKEEED